MLRPAPESSARSGRDIPEDPLEPAAGRHGAFRDRNLRRLARRHVRPCLHDIRRALGMVRLGHRRLLGLRAGPLRPVAIRRSRSPRVPGHATPGLVPSRFHELRGARTSTGAAGRRRHHPGREIPEPRGLGHHRPRAPRPGRTRSRRTSEARRRPWRSCRGLGAERPRGRGRPARHGQPRRDLVIVRVGIRSPGGHRPVRSARADRPDRGGRLSVRCEVDRPDRRPGCDPKRPSEPACDRDASVPRLAPGEPNGHDVVGGAGEPSTSPWSSNRSASIIRCMSCSLPGRPGSRRRSSTGTAASSSSTPRRSPCTPTSGAMTGSSGSPRRGG